jgi:hypothetical protein
MAASNIARLENVALEPYILGNASEARIAKTIARKPGQQGQYHAAFTPH